MTSLKKQAEALGIDVDGRWSDETLREKIAEAKNADKTVAPNHEPAQTKETANRHGEEVEGDRAVEQKADGKTNPVDEVKNTEPGPGNPDRRHTDLAVYTEDEPRDNEGQTLKTEETPKVVHETVSAAGAREITNNTIPDMSERPALAQRAEELGIMVDPEWDANRLRGEIQMAREGRADWQVKGAVPPEGYGNTQEGQGKGTPVKLKRDYWGEGGRLEKGTEVHLPRDQAKRLIDNGVAERNDPLPG